MASIRFEVPGPPVPWARTRGEGAGRFTPSRYRRYKFHLKGCMHHAVLRHDQSDPEGWPHSGKYLVALRAFFGDARHRDIDNVLKAVLDAGQGPLWKNDSQVAACLPIKVLSSEEPRLEVWVCTLTGTEDWLFDRDLASVALRLRRR